MPPIGIVISNATNLNGLSAADVSPDELKQSQIEFFESKIRPALIEHCYECHSTKEGTIEGGLEIDTAIGRLKGGNSGPVIIPGDPDHSLLMQVISHRDKEMKMPPDNPMPQGTIQNFQDWIKRGAVDGRSDDSEEMTSPWPAERQYELNEKQEWAFSPPTDVIPPTVANESWPRSDFDRFILANIESKALDVSPPASDVVWLRRVTFDLIGLPPSSKWVERFEALTNSPDKHQNVLARETLYEEVVDELLNSSAYGERWGRHWLDVVHYADSSGCNSDFPIPQIAQYRNWVIDAINRDMPYPDFVRAQLAGDILATQQRSTLSNEDYNRLIIATGYIANARRFGSRHEDYPQHLTIEDTIDNVGKTFLGLSLACARCHDHKFDPITSKDYYGLYGFFENTRYPWPGIETEKKPRDLIPLGDEKEFAAKNAEHQAEQKRLDEKVKVLEDRLKAIPEGEEREKVDKEKNDARSVAEKHSMTPIDMPMAYAVAEKKEIKPVRVQYKGDPLKLGPEVPRHIPVRLTKHVSSDTVEAFNSASDTHDGSGRLALADWIVSEANPLTARVVVNRIWKHHFGVGLVSTPSDFGKQGRAATNPQLLDWLAINFNRHGSSSKWLHRQIVLSATYRQQSLGDPSLESRDPANETLRGFRRQRLDAESFRDTLLALGGNLDRTPSESHPFPAQSEWNYTQHNPFVAVYPSNKRSVYLMTQRIQRHPYLGIFDGADPSISTAARIISTTPLQALYLFNDEFVHQQAELFGKRITDSSVDMRERIRFAFREALGRSPTEDEIEKSVAYLDKLKSLGDSINEREMYQSFARSLFRLNELIYVD